MFGNVKKPSKPVVIRKVSVARPTDQPAVANRNAERRAASSQAHGSGAKSGFLKARDAVKRVGSGSANGLLSVKRRQDSKTASPSPSLSDSRRSSGNHKRKAPSPSVAPDFGSSSDDESDEETGEGSRKRIRASPRNGTLEPDMKRKVLDEDSLKWDEEAAQLHEIIHGYDLTFGKFKEYTKCLAGKDSDERDDQENGSDQAEAVAGIAELQYPSKCEKER
jgi:hypothetical protein